MKKTKCSQEHFIQAIKGDLVLKVLNRDYRGQPAQKFKKIKAIFESEDTHKLSIASNVDKQEGVFTSEPSDNRKSTSVDSDDDNIGSMTLKEMRAMSKTKKRKLSQSDETASPGSISSSKIDLIVEVEVEAAYEENLSILNMKLKTMKKTNYIAPCMFFNSQVSVDESVEQAMNCQSFFENIVYEHGPITNDVADSSTLGSYVNLGYGGEFYDEMLQRPAKGSMLEIEESHSFHKAVSSCATDDIPQKYFEPAESSLLASTTDHFGEIPNAYFPEVQKSLPSFLYENLEVANITHSDLNHRRNKERLLTGELDCEIYASIQKETLLSSNQGGYIVTQMPDLTLNDSLQRTELCDGIDEIVPDGDDEDDKYMDICVVKPNVIFQHLDLDVAENYASTQQEKLSCHKDTDSVLCYSPTVEVLVANELDNVSIQLEELPCQKDKDSLTQMPNMSLNNNLQCTELHYGGDGSLPDSNDKDDKDDISYLKPNAVSEYLEEASTNSPVLYYSPSEEISVTNDLGSEKYASSQQGKLSWHKDGDTVTQMPDYLTLNNSLRCTELCDGIDEIVPDSDDEGDKDDISDLKLSVADSKSSTYTHDILTTDTPQPMELSNGGSSYDLGEKNIFPELTTTLTNICDSVSSQDSYPSLSPNNVSDLMVNGQLKDEGKHSSLTASLSLFASDEKAAFQGSSGIYSYDATNGVKDVETLEGCLREDTEICPKRLLSTRKVISPTSQENLCRGLNAGDSYDNEETFSCREKLFVEEQLERKNSLGELCVEGVDVKTLPRQNIKKPKNNKIGHLLSKGSLKIPPSSRRKQCSNTNFASELTSAQKAIKFSQRQMLDIDTLASKLMEELKIMKAIVEETLCSDVGQATSSKYNADQIKAALQNAAGVERKTKKFLYIMTRDCDRFSKIMKMPETKPSLPFGYEIHKKKKIRFADEDGGKIEDVYKYSQHA